MTKAEPLRRRLLATIARGYNAPLSDDEFNDLALAAHAHQCANSPAIRALTPAPPRHWREIPFVPTKLFARHVIAAFPSEEAVRVFLSSGTTAEERSRHYFRDLALYRAASLAGARWAFGAGPWRVRSLVPPAVDSSLATMCGWIVDEFAGAPPAAPTLLLGTAFDFVNRIDAGWREKLPAGSLVVETGGYKGRSREVAREELHAMIASALGLGAARIIAEYGMCELSSPLWERPGKARGFVPPTWLRVRLVDPETLADSPRGLVALYDLANLDSSVGLLTGDLGRFEGPRLLLEGRLAGVEIRGCSRRV